jgi:hypothetical protein
MALQPNLLAAADHGDELQQQCGDRLALLLGRGLGPPKGGKILNHFLDGRQLGQRRPAILKVSVVAAFIRFWALRGGGAER